MNAKTQHTPGPWSYERDRSSGDYTMYGKGDGGFTCQIGVVLEDDMGAALPAIANACLIAAAPDMLAICNRILNHPLIRITGDVEVPLRAAVAKASQP